MSALEKTSSKKRVSILIPVYNEENNIFSLIKELTEVLETLPYEFELMFVNDGSKDGSLATLIAAAQETKNMVVIDLSRNFGKEAAISCGLDQVTGDAIIIMDSDLQHPPDVIPTMLNKWEEGFDMVVPINEKRTQQPFIIRTASRMFYRAMDYLSRVEMVQNGSDFRLMDKKVVEVIRQLKENRRFMKAIYAWPGYKVESFPYTVRGRHSGSTSWNFWSLWNFALDGIFNFSAMPLKIWTYVGFFIASISLTWAFVIGIKALIYGIEVVEGITTVAVFLFFTIALVMIQGGILGEYIARIFDEVKGRPVYVIRDRYESKPDN